MNIGQTAAVSGDVSSSEDLLIEGHVRGRILAREASVLLGPQANVDADIRARKVRIHGTVRGTITATERISLSPTATVTGNLSADRVVIAEGARFDGRIDMGRRTIAARVAHYRTRPAGS